MEPWVSPEDLLPSSIDMKRSVRNGAFKMMSWAHEVHTELRGRLIEGRVFP